MPQTFFEWVAFILEEYYPLFIKGTINTVIVAISGTVIGFIIGLIVAVIRTIPVDGNDNIVKKVVLKIIKALLLMYIEVFRGTPMIVQAMVIYYGCAQYLNIRLPIIGAAILIISINTGAYMAEIIRGGIISVDPGQTEGAHAIGMTHRQTMISVVLPQAVRNIMPSIGNEFVVNIKDSSVLNVISVTELYFMTKSAAGSYLRYFECFFIAAVIYLMLTLSVTRILRYIEKRMDGKDTYEIFGSQSDPDAEIHIKVNDADFGKKHRKVRVGKAKGGGKRE